MIVLVLAVRRCAIVTVRARRHPIYRADGGAGNDRLQTEFAEIFHRHPDHALKSDVVTDLHRFLALIAAPGRRKSLSVAFCVGICHPAYRLLRQLIHKACHRKLRLRNILAEAVQIAQIAQITIHNDRFSKIQRRIQRLTHPPWKHPVTIITDKIVERLAKLRHLRSTALKQVVNLNKQFLQHRHIHQTALIGVNDRAADLRIEK